MVRLALVVLLSASLQGQAQKPLPSCPTPHTHHVETHRTKHGYVYTRDPAVAQCFRILTGYPHGRKGYVVDHIIPLACGGPDAVTNLQWQSIKAGKAKDKWERKDCQK